MKREYPANNAVCITDQHWTGRNLLRDAFLKSSGHSRYYQGRGPKDQRDIVALVTSNRPLYWTLESPEVFGRRSFPQQLAERDAACARAFLEVNHINVTAEQEDIQSYLNKTPWEQRDLARVYGDGSFCDPYCDDPATIAILPEMERKIWNLVRYHYDDYKF